MTVARKRSERMPLTRDRVLGAAMDLADEDGIDALTMRRLADQLGVEAMSIYHHLPNKSAILDGARRAGLPRDRGRRSAASTYRDRGTPWIPGVRSRILGARRVMLRHRWVPGVMESRGVMTPTMARYVDAIVAAMRAGGLLVRPHPPLACTRWAARMFGFTQELMLDSDAPSGEDLTLMHDFVPHLAAMLEDVVHDDPDSTLGWCDDQTEFEFGLDVLLEGLERRRPRRRRDA